MYPLRGNKDPALKTVLLFLGGASLFSTSPPFPDKQLFERAVWNSGKEMQKGF